LVPCLLFGDNLEDGGFYQLQFYFYHIFVVYLILCRISFEINLVDNFFTLWKIIIKSIWKGFGVVDFVDLLPIVEAKFVFCGSELLLKKA